MDITKPLSKLFLPLRDGAGCSSKIPPSTVHDLLSKADLRSPTGSIASQAQDDAAAILQPDGSWLILTTDNSMLTGATPFQCGLISALNAMSDVWAMGGKPRYLAGTLIGSPRLANHDIVDILRGADAAAGAAGAFYVTGQMNQLLSHAPSWLGFTAVGYIERDRPLMLKRNLQEGQLLITTKPVGSGLMLMALQDGLSSGYEADKVLDSMCVSNELASEILSAAGVNACTDISGSGIGGSLAEMASASCVSVTLEFERIPFFPGTLTIAQGKGARPALNEGNAAWAHYLARWVFQNENPLVSAVLFDPQTSGGLLAGVSEDIAERVLRQMVDAGIPAEIIGRVDARGEAMITVVSNI